MEGKQGIQLLEVVKTVKIKWEAGKGTGALVEFATTTSPVPSLWVRIGFAVAIYFPLVLVAAGIPIFGM
jgi:hypothetical protein